MNFRTTILLIVLPIAVLIAVHHGKLPVEKQGHVGGPFHDIKVTPTMLDQALSGARTQHKLLMVEFGANWCADCLALSRHLEQEGTRDYLEKHFVLFKVDVGEFNRNLEMAKSLVSTSIRAFRLRCSSRRTAIESAQRTAESWGLPGSMDRIRYSHSLKKWPNSDE